MRSVVAISNQRSKFTAGLIWNQVNMESRLRQKLDSACSPRYVENLADDLSILRI